MIKNFFITIFFSLLLIGSSYSKESFFNEAKNLFDKEKYKESKFLFQRDIVFNPKKAVSYLYLAKIFNEEKNDIMEEQYLNTVILLNPKNEEALYLLALLKIKKSDYEEANNLIKKFVAVCKIFCDKKLELKTKLQSLETN